MKILRIIYDWPPPWQGLAAHPYELTVSQAKLGHKIHVMCGRWPNAGPIEKPEGVTLYPIFREPFPGTLEFTSCVILFFQYLWWRQKNKDVDVIHSHGHFGIWIYAYRMLLQKYFPWAQELKTPLIVHFHNTVAGRWAKFTEEDKAIKPVSKNISWPMEKFSDETAVKVAAACVFVSNDTKEEAIKHYGADPRRCFVVETGVNPAMFRPVGQEERDKSRAELGFDMYDKVILNHGTMNERKNIHLIVEALALLPENYNLLLVGPWDTDYEQKVAEIIRNKHLESRIVKIGYTPYRLVPIAFHNADVFVLPSSWEGLPKVVMQALAANVPCVVSGFKLNEEIKGVNYLDSLDVQLLADKIKEVVESHQQVDMGKVATDYSWDNRARELDRIYDFAKKNYLV